MKKYSIALLFCLIIASSLPSFAQSQETYKKVAQETCDCINKEDVSSMTKNQVEAALGVCMLQVIQNNKIEIEITDSQAMRSFGEKVGVLMAPICPAVFKVFIEERASGDAPKATAIDGKVKSIENDTFLYLIVKDDSGNEHRIIWLSYFEGSDAFVEEPKKLVGKNVTIRYRTVQYYMPKAKGYMSVKELIGLKTKE